MRVWVCSYIAYSDYGRIHKIFYTKEAAEDCHRSHVEEERQHVFNTLQRWKEPEYRDYHVLRDGLESYQEHINRYEKKLREWNPEEEGKHHWIESFEVEEKA